MTAVGFVSASARGDGCAWVAPPPFCLVNSQMLVNVVRPIPPLSLPAPSKATRTRFLLSYSPIVIASIFLFDTTVADQGGQPERRLPVVERGATRKLRQHQGPASGVRPPPRRPLGPLVLCPFLCVEATGSGFAARGGEVCFHSAHRITTHHTLHHTSHLITSPHQVTHHTQRNTTQTQHAHPGGVQVAASSTVSTDEEAAAAVAAAWDKCFKDTAPFNRIP